jgi:hypothetical protein
MAMIPTRHSQRYNVMNHDAFVTFTNNSSANPSAYSAVIATLPVHQQ